MTDHLRTEPPAPSPIGATAGPIVEATAGPPAASDASSSSSAVSPSVSVGAERVDAGPIEQDLAAIDAALARLDAGTYGTCEVCGDALGDAVLSIDPVARFCTGHLPGTIS